MKMTTIRIDQIDPNPYRDFGIYPINQEQIEALKTSFSTRDFGIIAVRPMGNRYQQVYGHHRIEALRQMGITTIDCKVEMIDDDQMVKEMSAENATQQGNSFPAQVDSVAAIIRRLAYWLLISESHDGLSAIAEGLFDTEHAYQQAKRSVLNGVGIGAPFILSYSPSLKRQVVDGAIAHLKATGLMADIVGKVQAQVESELKAHEAAEKARQAAAEKARKEAEEEERKALEAAKASAAAAAKAQAARKAAAEAQAAADADRAAKMAELRKVEAEKEAKRRAEEAAKQEAQRKASADAQKAQAEFAEKSRGLHPGVLNLLRGEYHHRVFQRIVTTDAGRKVFPTERQVDMVKEMYATIESAKGKEATADDVAQWCNEQIGKANAEFQRMLEQNEKLRQSQSKAVKAKALVEEARTSMNRFSAAIFAIGDACDKDDELRTWILDDMNFMLPKFVDSMEKSVEVLRSRFGVKSYRDPKQVEKVVVADYTEFKQVK